MTPRDPSPDSSDAHTPSEPGFAARFGHPIQVWAEAHGRVNLIGEHTDYNAGFVLPALVPQRTRVELAATGPGAEVRAFSAQRAEDGVRAYRLDAPRRDGSWLDYVQGVTVALARAGHALAGFDAWITSTVPLGAGLSSSAALEVALLRGLRRLFGLTLEDMDLARTGQRAENDFVGAPVGIMDQMACSLAAPGCALFLDTRDLRWQQIPLPPNLELCVIDSGQRHRHADGAYATRRAECQAACARLGVATLRDLAPAQLEQIAALPPPLMQRARHVVRENQRVLAAVAALRAGDLPGLGAILYAGHESLRDDYEVSTPALDLLVDLARAEPAIHGARLTGGGFGGAVVLVAAAGRGRDAAQRIAAEYRSRTGQPGAVLVPVEPPTTN